ncbi:hypothetical protein [Acidovorax sp. SDU_ACID1]|uniref:hypothetical protein n=1 Tax=Acidovorax sp. SDU_ACID1 TaxID=3136632 RepID=UPI003872C20A
MPKGKTTPPVHAIAHIHGSTREWGMTMFWITVLGLGLSWMLVKFGAMSATASFLMLALKLLLVLTVIGGLIGVWAWFRHKP